MPLFQASDLDFPRSVVPMSRVSGVPGRVTNGTSAGSAFNIPAQTMSVFPFYIPQTLSVTSITQRTSGSATLWPGTQGSISYSYRFYRMVDGLPGDSITSSSTFGVPANQTSNTSWTITIGGMTLPQGWLWMGFAAMGTSIELAGISTTNLSLEAMMFSKFVGVGYNQTSLYVSFATGLDAVSLPPDSLASRTVDLATTTASQTTLRARTGAPMIWLGY